MITLFKIIMERLRKAIVSLLEEYLNKKYPNRRVFLCSIDTKNGLISFKTPTTRGDLTKNSKIEYKVRKQVGENIFTLFGIPKSKHEIPVVFLFIWPSVIKAIGIKRTYKLIKEWPGQSEIRNGIIVVRYSGWIRNRFK